MTILLGHTFTKPTIKGKGPGANPFLKWVGGKRQLLDDFDNIFPDNYNVYHEPMVGGGAVFFHLAPDVGVINDSNEDLMTVYETIRDNVDSLIDLLRVFKKEHDRDFYYEKRTEFNKLKRLPKSKGNKLKLSAYFIYLNRTCFNGLYRVNKKGEFNVPIGRYDNPRICDEGNLRLVSKVLKNVKLLCGDFEEAVGLVKKDDFVYFDPPYYPVSETAKFTEYTNGGFGKEGQVRLAETFKRLNKRGALIALSNSNTELINELYKGFTIHILKAKRLINSKASRRGEMDELLITNF